MRTMLLLALGAVLCVGQFVLAAPQGAGGAGGTGKPGGRLEMLTQALGLTTDQQAKVKPILDTEREQIKAVLTADQLAKLGTLMKSGTPPQGDPLQTLGLSADQQAKIHAIHKTANDAIRALLTPDQQTKLDALLPAPPQDPRLAQLTQALTLTTDQQAQAKPIFDNERTQIKAVLTADQQAKLEELKKAGTANGDPLRSLDLTTDQQTKIQAIHKTAMDAFRAILTADQQKKFDQMRPGGPGGQGQGQGQGARGQGGKGRK